ncbi:MAG: FecR domain-containing protein [Chitinophagaceae bacterium]
MNEQQQVEKALDLAPLIIKSMRERESLTTAEQATLNEWLQQGDNSALYEELMNEPDAEAALERLKEIDAQETEPALQRLHARLFTHSINRRPWWKYAAAAVLVIAAGSLAILYSKHSQPAQTANHPVNTIQDIAPGGKKAVLELADGSKITLDDAGNGKLAMQDASTISKTGEGALQYEAGKDNNAALVYNTLSTPRGGEYELTLSDGTKIWLNAATTLRYPASFNGRDRVIELVDGEAYFEVAKQLNPSTSQRVPFKVQVKNTIVEVKGTHFNINAYSDEVSQSVTLLEGAVAVSGKQNSITLAPGEQTEISSQRLLVLKANVEQTIAWRNGQFSFVNTDIKDVMQRLARWYDMDIEFKDIDIKANFNGHLNRNEPVNELLEVLAATNGAHFTIQGKKVIISK